MFALVTGLLGVVVLPSAARGAVCADHPNQRSAQQAKDTRDADGDGIYCEALPCPCLRPGQSGGGGAGGGSPAPSKPATPKPKKPKKKKPKYVAPREIEGVTITSVIDGDTVRARTAKGGYLKVRLLGIDAPEKSAIRNGSPECGGQQATDALEAFRAEHEEVTLVTDPTQDRYDAYDRLLAYIEPETYDLDSEETYQQVMLSGGWAEAYVYGSKPFKRFNRFDAAALTAAEAGVGVWQLCAGNFHLPIDSVSATSPGVTPPALALPRMSHADARMYIEMALADNFGDDYDAGYGHWITGCKNIVPHRVRCSSIGWYVGDLTFEGTADAWYSGSADGQDVDWNYAWTLRSTDGYCVDTGRRNCTRTHRVT